MGCGYFIICVILFCVFPPLGIFMLLLGILATIVETLNKINDKTDKK